MPSSLRTKSGCNIQFVPMIAFEQNKKNTIAGYAPLGMSAVYCRESFCYRLSKSLRKPQDIDKLTLSFVVGKVTYRTVKVDKPSGPEWNDFIKLLDILVGCVAISIVPQELLDNCSNTKAGNYTISNEGIVTYNGVHPKIFLWHPSVTSLLCGLVRTAMAINGTPRVRDLFLSNKQLTSMAIAAINNKDKDLAKLVVVVLKDLFAKNIKTTHLFGSKSHFDIVRHLQEGHVPAHKTEPVLTWKSAGNLADYGPNGFKNYGKWLKSTDGKLYATGKKTYEVAQVSG